MASVTYLLTRYEDRAQVKALGARWDATARRWFVPPGIDLAAFAPWLPACPASSDGTTPRPPLVSGESPESRESPDLASSLVVTVDGAGSALPALQARTQVGVFRKGVPLSQLLAAVSRAVSAAFEHSLWAVMEVVNARLHGENVYLEVSERTADGRVVATASAVIWSNTARRILPPFECRTGLRIGPGIKLLLRVRPVFKARYGLSLEVDDIDPDYTLGDLEARRREIRQRLQREGIFDANKRLPAPWDFNAVLVLAPQGAAGLGDFQAEADRLERFGICSFAYVHSRFQGEGAAAEARGALLQARLGWGGTPPDAVAIIRGGGAVNDLAWLDDYELARCVCEFEVPVFTGIGHERDSTILDEVAHTRFDTPSKVILGIEQVIRGRAREARESFEYATQAAARVAATRAREAAQFRNVCVSGALQHLVLARRGIDGHFGGISRDAMQTVRKARESSQSAHADTRDLARQQVAAARQAVPYTFTTIMERSDRGVRDAQQIAHQARREVESQARRLLAESAAASQALMREISGQGPQKTLGRGFAIVRSITGQPLTSAQATPRGGAIEIEFRDGVVAARLQEGSSRP